MAATLRNEIVRGLLPAGSHLLQHAMAARLGVSPTPVREAFAELALEGYVEWDPFRGVRVAERSDDAEALVDMYELRAHLETIAVRRALRAHRCISTQALENAERESLEAERANHPQRSELANSRFHAALVAMAGSPLLDQIMAFILRRSLFHPSHLTERTRREHHAIVAALKANDRRTARRLVSQHARANVDAAAQRPAAARGSVGHQAEQPRRRRADGPTVSSAAPSTTRKRPSANARQGIRTRRRSSRSTLTTSSALSRI
ncbi:MAG: GntR family transcriptional regulator [Chloroflexota bacterium]|nr:GntR family transcriptional regulator [Chloroflexota bacterium]